LILKPSWSAQLELSDLHLMASHSSNITLAADSAATVAMEKVLSTALRPVASQEGGRQNPSSRAQADTRSLMESKDGAAAVQQLDSMIA
jgi:hypothetical protein